MDLRDKNIIITGGAGGIGAHLVNHLSALVRNVIAIDVNGDGIGQWSDKSNVFGYVCDLTDFVMTEKTINQIFDKFNEIHILVNNAGLIHSELMYSFLNKDDKKHSLSNWSKVLNINLNTTFYCSLFVIERMIQSRIKGLIINVSSISAKGNAGQSAYSAAKAGIDALTVTWGRELSVYGIRTVGIAPGFFDTVSTTSALKEQALKKIISEIPLRRLGKLDEITKTIIFIAENDYINGKIIEVDGGLVLSHG